MKGECSAHGSCALLMLHCALIFEGVLGELFVALQVRIDNMTHYPRHSRIYRLQVLATWCFFVFLFF